MKRILSVLIVFVFIFSVTPTSKAAGNVTVYFHNDQGWEDIRVWAWGNVEYWPEKGRPGPSPTYIGGRWYSIEVPADIQGIVFSGIDVNTGIRIEVTDLERGVMGAAVTDFDITRHQYLDSWGMTRYRPSPELISGIANVGSPVETGDKFMSVAAGYDFTVAVKTDGSFWEWGNGATKTPTTYYTISDVVAVSAGYSHRMILTTDGSLYAQGYSWYGALGDGSTGEYRWNPVKVLDGVSAVEAGPYHTMALKTDGSLWVWGDNSEGQLGNGKISYYDYDNFNEETGEIPFIDNNASVPIKIMDDVVSISAGRTHSAAVKKDGSLWTWGSNETGQLCDGTRASSLNPIKVMDEVVMVEAGGSETFVVRTDGTLWGWESYYSSYYDLDWWGMSGGPGFAPVKLMDNVKAVETSLMPHDEYDYCLVIKTDGSLWAWGENSRGQLGLGTVSDYGDGILNPTKVMDDVVGVSAGTTHTVAVKNDGSLWAWGNNVYGRLGDGNETIYGEGENSWEIVKNNDCYSPVKIMDGVLLSDMGLTLNVSAIADQDNPNITTGNKISWSVQYGVSSFDIYRSVNGGAYTLLISGIQGVTYIDLDIQADTKYTYIVCPEGNDPEDNSSSNEVTIMTGTETAPLLLDKEGNLGKANSYILMQINNPIMNVNGLRKEIDPGRGTRPLLRKDRTVLPISSIVKEMSGTAEWDGSERKVSLEANGNTVTMWIDKMKFTVNGEDKEMDIAPFIENDRTFIPLRFAATNLNCRVTWVNATREVLIVWNSGKN